MARGTTRLLLSAFLFCFLILSLNSFAEDELVVDSQNGWFGIYIDGAKVGHAAWAIERKEGAKNWYKLTWEETRTRKVKDKEFQDTVSATASLGPGLLPDSLKLEENRGGRKTFLTVKVDGNVAELVTTFAGQKPMPSQKVALAAETQFGFCAPLTFAWKCCPRAKPAVFSRLHEMGRAVLTSELICTDTSIKFEGADIQALLWADSARRHVLLTDGNGKLLQVTEMATNEIETRYQCECEDVALSNMTWEQKREQDRAREEKAAEDAKPKQKKSPGSAQTLKERMCDPLDHVPADADYSKRGEYLKIPVEQELAVFSIRAAKAWECYKPRNEEQGMYIITPKSTIAKGLRINIGESDGLDGAAILEQVDKLLVERQEDATFNKIGEIETVELGKRTAAHILYSVKLDVPKGLDAFNVPDEMRYMFFVITGDSMAVVIMVDSTREEFERWHDAIYSMLGSVRFE